MLVRTSFADSPAVGGRVAAPITRELLRNRSVSEAPGPRVPKRLRASGPRPGCSSHMAEARVLWSSEWS